MCSQQSPGRWNTKSWESHIILLSVTFRQAEEIVGLLPIGLGLQIFMAISTRGNDHPYGISASVDIEAPFTFFNSDDGVLLCDSPRSSIAITASDVGDVNNG